LSFEFRPEVLVQQVMDVVRLLKETANRAHHLLLLLLTLWRNPIVNSLPDNLTTAKHLQEQNPGAPDICCEGIVTHLLKYLWGHEGKCATNTGAEAIRRPYA